MDWGQVLNNLMSMHRSSTGLQPDGEIRDHWGGDLPDLEDVPGPGVGRVAVPDAPDGFEIPAAVRTRDPLPPPPRKTELYQRAQAPVPTEDESWAQILGRTLGGGLSSYAQSRQGK